MRVLLLYTDAEFYAGLGFDRAWSRALADRGADVEVLPRPAESWSRQGPPDADLVIAHVLNEELFVGGETARAASLFEASGRPLLNPLNALYAAGDKLVCHGAWAAHGLPQPRTWGLDALDAWPVGPGEVLVLKSSWGDGAWEVTLAGSLDEARDIAGAWRAEERRGERKPLGPMVVQERVHEPDCIRLFATPTRCSKAYEKARDPGALKTHGTVYPTVYEPEPALAQLAQRMVATIGGGLMGVDVLRAEDGRLLALEANGPFGFDVTDPGQVDWIADAALEHARRAAARRPHRSVAQAA